MSGACRTLISDSKMGGTQKRSNLEIKQKAAELLQEIKAGI